MKYDVIVMGSINMDMFVYVDDFPNYGENMLANNFETLAGGKGANQAVTIAKQGVKHTFLGAVGDDDFGIQMIKLLNEMNINTDSVIQKENTTTGTAVGIVDETGENTFMVLPGANAALTETDIQQALKDLDSKVFLLQMETSRASILEALKIAKNKGMYIILDPAPETGIFEEALAYADLVTPNRQEAEKLTGITINSVEDATKAAKEIAKLGVKNAIVKLGAEGSVVFESDKGAVNFVKANKVKAVNTTGAGDVFAGVLASLLSQEDIDLVEATEIASAGSALKVSRHGGHEAIPTKEEIINYRNE
ncbi:ribokinase [Dolosicoccus paucivorans]|uniref:Ribokinase n=1 Tax=Dolosicoccus paucivorans TaxID=84521 RepID=A0A2N6SPM1_9LACT|nr:ribokinase [Dolosicoccus paucivorans]PMB85048.1 ribokinase [Dolosicoccus paucivorans]PMC58996.1 ribokinase [Dolosicoccus paucivorans]